MLRLWFLFKPSALASFIDMFQQSEGMEVSHWPLLIPEGKKSSWCVTGSLVQVSIVAPYVVSTDNTVGGEQDILSTMEESLGPSWPSLDTTVIDMEQNLVQRHQGESQGSWSSLAFGTAMVLERRDFT